MLYSPQFCHSGFHKNDKNGIPNILRVSKLLSYVAIYSNCRSVATALPLPPRVRDVVQCMSGDAGPRS